jgi:hypothetical protein
MSPSAPADPKKTRGPMSEEARVLQIHRRVKAWNTETRAVVFRLVAEHPKSLDEAAWLAEQTSKLSPDGAKTLRTLCGIAEPTK